MHGGILGSALVVPDDHACIQQAADAAVDGDTVLVMPGIYEENIRIADKTVHLLSAGGVKKTVIDGRGENVIILEGNGSASVTGFTVRNGNHGIMSFSCTAVSRTIKDNIITGNRKGILISDLDRTRIVGNRIENNAPEGGIHIQDSSPEIYNNVITGNSAAWGGGIRCECAVLAGHPEIVNNTVTGNSAEQGGGIFIGWDAHVTVMNNIIAMNSGDGGIWRGPNGYPDISYNDVYDNEGEDYVDCSAGVGAISVNPLFISDLNLHLQEGSPCRDAGNPHADYNDRDGSRNDLGATGGPHFDRDLLVAVGEKDPPQFRSGTFTLHANYPNPFNPSTVIRFHIPEEGNISVSIYNVIGEEVAVLYNGMQSAGAHEIRWDASDLPGGVYFVRVALEGISKTGKMMMVR